MSWPATTALIALLGSPHLVATPKATYNELSDAHGTFVSIGVKVRLDHRFADGAEQHRYAVVAAPHLERGQRLGDRLFGGTSLGRLDGRSGAWYVAEAIQLQRRKRVAEGARWQVALARANRIVGVVKTVRLYAAPSSSRVSATRESTSSRR
jgi:hypothetical protein